jgi:hypothetical protein
MTFLDPMRKPLNNPLSWFALVLLGFAILAAVAIKGGRPEDVAWYVTHVMPLLAVLLFSLTTLGKTVLSVGLITYGIALPVSALVAALWAWNEPSRLTLFTENANLLAADLVAVFFATTLIRPRWPWPWMLPLVAIAVALTGSRTGAIALLVATGAWSLLPRPPIRFRRDIAVSVLFLLAFLAFAFQEVRTDAAGANLLTVTTTFASSAWSVFAGSDVHVTPGAVAGPWPGTRADRIIARAESSTLTLYQSINRSLEGTPYVASVYLRSDTPQDIILSSHLAKTKCFIVTEWTRCTTPEGVGDDRLAMQFRFEVADLGRSFDVYAFGPQYETGTVATAYDARGGGLLSGVVAQRFLSVRTFSLDALVYYRWDQLLAAWTAFSESRWLGQGVRWAAVVVGDSGNAPPEHAHNLLAERLAAEGLIGLLGWLLISIVLVGPVLLIFGWQAAPWILALTVLNTWDMTWFHAGSYFSTAIVAGLSINRCSTRQRHLLSSGAAADGEERAAEDREVDTP